MKTIKELEAEEYKTPRIQGHTKALKDVLGLIDEILIKQGVCKNVFEIDIEGKQYAVKDAKIMLEKIEELKARING